MNYIIVKKLHNSPLQKNGDDLEIPLPIK